VQDSPSFFTAPVAPIALSATAVCAAQAIAGAGNALINGASATGGVATFDVPRAASVVSASAGDTTQTVTLTGTDVYGAALTETIALNGTSTVNGKKAFKTITQAAVSAATAGNLSVGSTDILGLPYRVDSRAQLLVYWDTAFVTTGTFVAAVSTTATATTGDVRGTFVPPTATNGTRTISTVIFSAASNTNNLNLVIGVAQA